MDFSDEKCGSLHFETWQSCDLNDMDFCTGIELKLTKNITKSFEWCAELKLRGKQKTAENEKKNTVKLPKQ